MTDLTYRDRILSALRHEPVDCLPWVPRLDLWYKSNLYRDTLPQAWRDAALLDIARELGAGFHAVIPDFLDSPTPDEAYDRVLGLDHVPNQPFTWHFRRTTRTVEHSGEYTRVTYRHPAGELTGVLRYSEQMRRDGATLMHTEEQVVKTPADYAVVAALFEDIEVVCDESRYRALCADVGTDGLVVAFANIAASPGHHLLKELVPFDQFFYHMYDCPEHIEKACERMQGYFRQVVEACCRSSAEAVMLGANYDVMVTPPTVFEQYIVDDFRDYSDTLHAAEKLVVTHTDGENEGILPFYRQMGIDVADSVCPAPMTRLSLAEYRRTFAQEIAVWGGICSVSVLPESFTDEQFAAHVEDVLQAAGDGCGLIVSIADTTPPDACIERLRYIGSRIREFKVHDSPPRQ